MVIIYASNCGNFRLIGEEISIIFVSFVNKIFRFVREVTTFCPRPAQPVIRQSINASRTRIPAAVPAFLPGLVLQFGLLLYMIPSPIINITADYIIPGTLFGTPPRLLFFSAFLPAVLHSKKAGQLGPDLCFTCSLVFCLLFHMDQPI